MINGSKKKVKCLIGGLLTNNTQAVSKISKELTDMICESKEDFIFESVMNAARKEKNNAKN